MSAIVTEIVTDDIPEGEEFCKVTSDRVVTAFVVIGAISLACIITLVVGILPRLFGG